MRLYISKINLVLPWLLVFGLSLPGLAQAKGFTIRSVSTHLQNKVYLLDANIDYQFSQTALEALRNGVPLIVLLDIKVEQKRSWWFNKTIAELQQGYLLLYHALTEKYIVNNLNSGAQDNYEQLSTALRALGEVKDLPILDAHLTNKGDHYIVRLRTRLDLESLPAPMRPLAYISSDWRLESDWYQWPLQQ
ncbi:MAG: DUF4390 domain-containing protein [Gammaproteobacteria bacterium]